MKKKSNKSKQTQPATQIKTKRIITRDMVLQGLLYEATDIENNSANARIYAWKVLFGCLVIHEKLEKEKAEQDAMAAANTGRKPSEAKSKASKISKPEPQIAASYASQISTTNAGQDKFVLPGLPGSKIPLNPDLPKAANL